MDNEAAARREAYEKQAEVEKQQLLADAQKQADEIVAAGKDVYKRQTQNTSVTTIKMECSGSTLGRKMLTR